MSEMPVNSNPCPLQLILTLSEDFPQPKVVFSELFRMLNQLSVKHYRIEVLKSGECAPSVLLLEVNQNKTEIKWAAESISHRQLMRNALLVALYPKAVHGVFSWPWCSEAVTTKDHTNCDDVNPPQ